MSSFIAAGTAYANLGVNMIPFYFYYSMFGFQRIGDLIWAAGDSKAKGFLLGATAGRTTLNGEGLQHQDGHSHMLASTIPTLLTYDPAFAYEIAVIVRDGLRRLYAEGEEYFYYLTLYNENYEMPAMPDGVEDGHSQGLVQSEAGAQGQKVIKRIYSAAGRFCAKRCARKRFWPSNSTSSADVWSATSYKLLRGDALRAKRWNMLHPTAAPKKSYLETMLQNEEGVFVAVSDYMKMVPDQIAPWVPGGLMSLGHRRFRSQRHPRQSETIFRSRCRATPSSRRFTRCTKKKRLPAKVVEAAIRKLGIDPEKPFPFYR